jgi:transposase
MPVGEDMKEIQLPTLTTEAIGELDTLYRTTKDVRLRLRAQIILLAAEKELNAREIAEIVRKDDETVRIWLKRYQAEGVEGLKDNPRAGGPKKVTDAYREKLLQVVRLRPRNLGQPYSMWTLQRLADYMAEQMDLRVEAETVRVYLKAADIVLSRPQHTISSPDPDYKVKKRRLRSKETN